MTKEAIREHLKLAMNLAELTRQVCEKLESELAETSGDVLFDVLDEIQAYELTDLDEAMERLDDACAFTACSEDEEDTLQAPELLLGDDLSVVVRVPVNGGKLVLANGESDYGTKQIGLMYEKDGDLIDLALAEVKSGELAEIANQEPDNKDIDPYVFANPETEDYTNRYHIPYDKILAD